MPEPETGRKAPNEGISEELKEAREMAMSYPDRPPGEYIGSIETQYKIYHFYKHGSEYYYETDYDIDIRHERKLQKIRRNRKWVTQTSKHPESQSNILNISEAPFRSEMN